MDARSARSFLDAVTAVAAKAPVVVVDLDGVTTLDAFGRAALRRIARQAVKKTLLVVAEATTRQRLGELGRLLDGGRLVPSRRVAQAAAIAATVH